MYADERYAPSLTTLARSMFYYVQHMGCNTFDASFRIERSNYNSLLFTYTKSGSGSLEYRGQHYELTAGTLMFINCLEPHVYFTSDTHWEQSWLHVYGSECEAYYREIQSILENPVVHIEDGGLFFDCWFAMMQMQRNNDPNFDIRSSAIIVRLLTELMLLGRRSKSRAADSQAMRTISAVQFEMDARILRGEAYRVEEMAVTARMSQSHFSAFFKRTIGAPPYEYFLGKRIEAAKALLSGTELPIADIATRMGFDSASHFNRTFRRFELITPSRYRRVFSY